MSLWMILPISLPVFTITGIWVVYAMSLYNQHVCPVHNCHFVPHVLSSLSSFKHGEEVR